MYNPHTVEQYHIYSYLKEKFYLEYCLLSPLHWILLRRFLLPWILQWSLFPSLSLHRPPRSLFPFRLYTLSRRRP